jgi:hypothetical protein
VLRILTINGIDANRVSSVAGERIVPQNESWEKG